MKVYSIMKTILITLFTVLAFCGLSQEKFTISGHIKDASNGEELIGATVRVKNTSNGVATNVYGFYSITLEKGNYELIYSFIGFADQSISIELNQSIKKDIELGSAAQTLEAIEVSADRKDENVNSTEMSTVDVNIETIKKIPALMGEVDIIRAIQLLPGVQTAGEGSTGFFVRGGGADQNLILLDEATVFNASHLLGFFSVFNQDAIKDAKLYKGGIPARYGGRLSSVLDVRMKDGNAKRLSLSGGIGLISSRLTIEAPIVKDKGSFILSGRRTYADLFLKLSKNEDLRNSQLYFYDFNGKANYNINENNKLYLSGYFGRDILSLAGEFLMGWGNTTLTARWNHLFNDKLFSNLTLISSDFDYKLGVPEGVDAFEWNSSIKNYSLKNDYTYYANTSNTLRFGLQSTFLDFNPADFKPLDNNASFNPLKLPKKFALEHGIYASNEQRFGANLTIDYGLRFSVFQNLGKDTVYNFDQNFDTIPGNSFTAYQKGIYKTSTGLEPRLSVKYSLTDQSSIKASYNRMYQYLHLANNSTSGTPIDIWFPSGQNIAPRWSDQVALGYFRNFLNDKIESSVEVFYKTTENAIDFKDNAQLIFNRLLEGEVRIGEAKAYGAEFFVRKRTGKFTGWISYTLSKTQRRIEQINNNEWYNSNYDKPHNLSIVATYEINKYWNLGATFVYTSGIPLTAPTGKFNYQGQTVPIYSDRNGARIPSYNRADFSVTHDPKKNENRKWKSSWNLSVYNLYNQKNPFSITFNADENTGETTATKTYLFAIIPTITYNFKF